MPTAVVTGCNSGIAHAFAHILLMEARGYDVFATDVTNGLGLKDLQSVGARISELDVTSSESITAFKKDVLSDQAVDLLLNIAGIMALVVLMHPGYVKSNLIPKSQTLPPEAVEPEEAASRLWKVFMSKKIGDTGKFWHREGQELPW